MNDQQKAEALSPITAFRSRIEQMFDDFAQDFVRPIGIQVPEFLPSAEISQTKDAMNVSLELPGMEQKDVKISVEDNLITLSGEKRQSSQTDVNGSMRSERCYGAFVRTFRAPFTIDATKVDARFSNGVLYVAIGKPVGYVDRRHEIPVH
jgi:HSP20 family protein